MNEQEKQSNNDRNIGIFVIVLVFFGIFVYLFGRGSFGVEAPETITISRAQYNELKTIISEQGQRLTEFETNLQLLEQSSPELIVTLNELRVIARQNAETIRSCREILERSKAAHQRAEQILAEIERANQTPAEGAAPARNPG